MKITKETLERGGYSGISFVGSNWEMVLIDKRTGEYVLFLVRPKPVFGRVLGQIQIESGEYLEIVGTISERDYAVLCGGGCILKTGD